MAQQAEPALLRFGFNELQNEIQTLPGLAKEFLAPESAYRTELAARQLMNAKGHPEQEFTWQVSEEDPILTRASEAEYEDKKKAKGPAVVGALSFSWRLRVGPRPVRDLFVTGNATTKIKLAIVEDSKVSELGMWRMEVGDEAAPGCCFHVQVLGTEDEGPFPKSVSVPRLPTYPPTPMTCLEFLLSELFQQAWRKQVARDTKQIKTWRNLQRTRLAEFFQWQLQTIQDSNSSPLVRLKTFPGPGLFAET